MSPLYSAMLHSHELFVTLYVLLFLIKLIMLLMNKTEALARFRANKLAKIGGEMVLPMLFLITGIYLAATTNAWTETWFDIKFGLLIVAIVAGVFTFKNNNKVLGLLTLIIFIYMILLSYRKDPTLKKPEKAPKIEAATVVTDPKAPGYDMMKHGQLIYQKNGCPTCHGDAGDLGNHGAANLMKTTSDTTTIRTVIQNGRGSIMAPYGTKISPDELTVLSHYVKALQK